MKPINLAEKFGLFSEHWAPKIIAQMNDYQFKLVFRDGEVSVGPGEMFVVPKGKEHKTSAKTECQAMLVEIAGTVNTGSAVDQRTAPTYAWGLPQWSPCTA